MALCIVIDQTMGAGRPAPSAGGYTHAAFTAGEATKTADQWSCPAGTHLLMTVAEVNTPPEFTLDLEALGIDGPTILLVGSYGFAVVLGAFFLGWAIGIAKELIRKI